MVTTAALLTRPHLNIADVCRTLKVNPSTVWRWASNGLRGVRLPMHTLGGRKVVFQDELDNFIRDTSERPKPSRASPPPSASHLAAEAAADARGL